MVKWAGLFLVWMIALGGFGLNLEAQPPDNPTALERIEEALTHHAIRLDLSNLGLTALPAKITQLTWLESLSLDGNYFTILPPEVGELTSLTRLSLSASAINTLPPKIGQLTNLQQLFMISTNLRSLPPEIGQLSSLTYMDVSGTPVTELPPEIGQLTNLNTLHLNGTALTTLPPEIGQLSGLQTLHLSHSLLTTLPPEIAQLKGLKSFSLEDAPLTQLTPEIGQLVGLESLSLRGSQLTQLPPEIGGLVNLNGLDLSRTQLTILPPEIGGLVNLHWLDLSKTPLTTLPPEISHWVNLERLFLTDNVTMTLPPEIGQLAGLQQLNLTNTALTALPPEIGQLTQLKLLYLKNTTLTELPPEIGNLTSLESLGLTGNPIRVLPPEIGGLSNLKELYLSQTQISELPPEFYQLTNLYELDLSNTSMSNLPPEMGRLTNLRILVVMETAIQELPREILLSLPNLYEFQYDGGWAEMPATLSEEEMARRVQINWFTYDCQPPRYPYFEFIVSDFNQQQDEIGLTLHCIYVGQSTVRDRLKEYVDSGLSIDIVGSTSFDFASSLQGQWVDLQPLVDAAGYDLSQFPPNVVDAHRSIEGLLALPFAVYPGVLYYNADLFDAAGLNYPPTSAGEPYIMPDGSAVPWEYDTVTVIGQLLTLDADGHNAAHPDFDPENITQYGFVHQWDIMLSDFHTFGAAPLLDENNQVVIPEQWRAEAHWLWNSIWTYHISPTSSADWGELLDSNPFNSGHVAMARSMSWLTCCLGELTARWDLAVQPAYQGQIYAPMDLDSFYIHQSSQHRQEAFTVLQYLTDDASAQLSHIYGVFPARLEHQAAATAVKAAQFPDVQHWEVLSDSIPFAPVPSPDIGHLNHPTRYPQVNGIERLAEFLTLLRSEGGDSFDLDAELDKLQADLQAIVDAHP